MSMEIRSCKLNSYKYILSRDVNIDDNIIIQSININQTDGSFVVTQPLENNGQVIIYPQSPNNELYETKTYTSFDGYGDLYMPLDARFDFVRRKLWIADAGNQSILKLEINKYSTDLSIDGIILPHSIVPEINLGGVFVKGFSGINTGIINYYSKNGKLNDYFTFPCDLGLLSTDIEMSSDFVRTLPTTSTMIYDHVRWRLWWTAGRFVYMADISSKTIVENDLGAEYIDTRGIDIDLSSGNAFVIAKRDYGAWYLVQIFRDNNETFCGAYLPFGVFL